MRFISESDYLYLGCLDHLVHYLIQINIANISIFTADARLVQESLHNNLQLLTLSVTIKLA